MNRLPLPYTKELVLVGGGHAHALVLRKWAMSPLPGARVTLINPGPTAPYTGMLPGFVAGHYTRDDLSIDLVKLARFADVRLILGAVSAIDQSDQRLYVEGRAPIAYDCASINIGITSDPPDLPGFAEFGVPAKPLGIFARAWLKFKDKAGDSAVPITVIGGGVGGVELGLAMAHAMPNAKITIIEQKSALNAMGTRARQVLLKRLASAGISLLENVGIRQVTENEVHLQSGNILPSNFTVGAAGARPFDWLRDTELALNNGFIKVDETLKSSDPAIFAAGDCAALPSPRPKAGVFAVRQAPILLHNLQAQLSGGSLQRFKPQKSYLKLISLGAKSALADKWGIAFRGPWVWRWKDAIDQKFMRQFQELPEMPLSPRPAKMALDLPKLIDAKPLCGGCAAKVGASGLHSVLTQLPTSKRPDIVTGRGDDAAVLNIGGQGQVLTTDTLRAFTHDPFLLSRIAAIHALGDIWAMGAKPQAALAHVTLPPLSGDLQRDWLAEIMQAAQEIFGQSGAEIVGGHTALGAELSVGFSVTGLLDKPAITLAGAQAGDALILTKPLGTGTILAAEMQGKARGNIVEAAYNAIQTPQSRASVILENAHAMTDVTGFGLAGHLSGICKASKLEAVLNLQDIPLLDGAADLAQIGIRATLFEENVAAVPEFAPIQPAEALLFDPQTAGGLLAALPKDQAESALNDLQRAGYPAAIIGCMVEGEPRISIARA